MSLYCCVNQRLSASLFVIGGLAVSWLVSDKLAESTIQLHSEVRVSRNASLKEDGNVYEIHDVNICNSFSRNRTDY